MTFYRKLEALLSHINTDHDDENFLLTILHALQDTFGAELHICNGRLFEELHDGFVLFNQEDAPATPTQPLLIPLHGDAVQLVLTHGSYIFDSILPEAFANEQAVYTTTPVAFSIIRASHRRWLFVFDLTTGWVREEILLCLNTVRSALNNRFYTDSIKNNIAQAAQIQRSLLPERPPLVEAFDIAGRSQPAEDVGGDLYDYHSFEDGMLGVCVGDASGHGLPAALLVRDVVTGLRMGIEANFKISYTIKKLNKVIHQSAYSTRFVTLFYGEIEPNGNILYINAGHPPPLLIHGNTVTALRATGTVLGPLNELDIYRGYLYMKPESTLVLYSDGIIERTNRTGDLFGIERLQDVMKAHQEKSAAMLVDILFNTVYAFGEQTPWEDDATVVVLKRRKSKNVPNRKEHQLRFV